MKSSLVTKLESLCDRHEEVSALLSDAETASDPNKFRSLSQEYSQLDEVVKVYESYRRAQDDSAEAQVMLQDADVELREMAEEEITVAEQHMVASEAELQVLMLPKDPKDSSNVFLEIRAGTGGDEAAIFSGDLFRMYSRYAESKRWSIEVVSERASDHGGYKELIARVVGDSVYAHLKFESGAHRVQRVPETESQGRIHTSACTVAVMAEPDEVEEVAIRKEDLRVDTYRSSGAGGQHVNTTDSAVRITHHPTGIVVTSSEKSQHQNRDIAMKALKSRLYQLELDRRNAAINDAHESKGDAGWGNQIRSYVLQPYQMVKDLRTNYETSDTKGVLDGDITPFMEAVLAQDVAGMSRADANAD